MTAICKPKETPLQTFTLSGFHRSSDLIGGGAAAPKSYQTELEASSGREPSAAELNYQAQFLYADWRSKPIGGIRQKSRDPAVLRAVNWQKRQVERAATLSSWESRLDLTKEVSGDPSSAQARDQGFVGASYEAHRIKERQRTRDLQQHLSSHKLGSGERMMREDLCARLASTQSQHSTRSHPLRRRPPSCAGITPARAPRCLPVLDPSHHLPLLIARSPHTRLLPMRPRSTHLLAPRGSDNVYSEVHAHKDTESGLGLGLVPSIDPRCITRPKDMRRQDEKGCTFVHTVPTTYGSRPLLPTRSFMAIGLGHEGEARGRSIDF